MSVKPIRRHLTKLLFLFFLLVAAWCVQWYLNAKHEADTRFSEFNKLLVCKDEMGACWHSTNFNKMNYTDKIVRAAKDGLDAEFSLPWPSRERIGSYSGVILKLPPVEEAPRISVTPFVVT